MMHKIADLSQDNTHQNLCEKPKSRSQIHYYREITEEEENLIAALYNSSPLHYTLVTVHLHL